VNQKNDPARSQPLFGLGGRAVVAALAILFMILPGTIIAIKASGDLVHLIRESAPSVSLTATAMAIVLGSILAATGVLFLWKTYSTKP